MCRRNNISKIRRTLVCSTILIALSFSTFGCGKSTAKSNLVETKSQNQQAISESHQENTQKEKSQKEPSFFSQSENQPETTTSSNADNNTNPKNPFTQKRQSQTATPRQRPTDDRPIHNDLRLEKLGIHKYESKLLILYSDLDPEIAKTLPSIIDQVYDVWVEYFGELPPNPEKTKFQITGYAMKNSDLFQNAGLIPKNLRAFRSGQHMGLQFWMYHQKNDYYRKHLMIHEATHCFMYQMRSSNFPSWYMEGMAEFFGVHTVDAKGKYHFGVMPENEKDFAGFGRIQIIRNDCKKEKWIAFPKVRMMNVDDYISTSGYAWSWAMCQFLNSHPKYRDDFRALRKIESTAEFQQQYHRTFLAKQKDLGAEWLLFALGIQEGYDIASAAIEFQDGTPLATGKTSPEIKVNANRGWQPSGVEVEQGKTYEIIATGSFSLGNKPKPWISEPQGVSILYFQGKPLGKLLATIHTHRSSREIASGNLPQMTKTISVGRGITFQPTATGTLYFRVNDAWNSLSNNSGTVTMKVKKIATR